MMHSQTPSPMNILTISNLAAHCCETDLTKLFAPFGSIIRIKLTRKHDQKTRTIEGIAQVIFVSCESAMIASMHMQGYLYLGRQMIIRQDAPLPKTTQPSQGVKNSVHIRFTTSNIERNVSKMDLMRIFAPLGEINDVVIKASSIDHYAHHQSGYGFVDFCNRPEGLSAALKAVETLHNRSIDGINFHVELSRNILKRFENGSASLRHDGHHTSPGNAQSRWAGPNYGVSMQYAQNPSLAYNQHFSAPSPTFSCADNQFIPPPPSSIDNSQLNMPSMRQTCPLPPPLIHSMPTSRPPRGASRTVEQSMDGTFNLVQVSDQASYGLQFEGTRLSREALRQHHYDNLRRQQILGEENGDVPSLLELQNQTNNCDNSVSSMSSRTTVISTDYHFPSNSSPVNIIKNQEMSSALVSSSYPKPVSVPKGRDEMLDWTSDFSASTHLNSVDFDAAKHYMASNSGSREEWSCPAWMKTKGAMYISDDYHDEHDAARGLAENHLSGFTLSMLSLDSQAHN